jgi:6-methylsalicylate decarboxylase
MLPIPRIDTHMHIVPPRYAQWLHTLGINAGGREIPEWTVSSALDLMGAVGASGAVMSVSTPGVHLGDDARARAMAREVNEFAARHVQDHPRQLGFFATLTLPDVDGAIAEAAYAFDTLQADGVVLLANVRGLYLGDEAFAPLMEALDQRHAVVFVHPSELPAPPVPGIPPFAADFLLDTTRAAINMARNGWLERFPNLKIILSHAGGFLPYAAERVARVCAADGSQAAGLARLRRFYFDTALSSSPFALPALLAFAQADRITFGSDWPYAPQERSQHFARLLDEYPLSECQRTAIHQGNARQILRRWA